MTAAATKAAMAATPKANQVEDESDDGESHDDDSAEDRL